MSKNLALLAAALLAGCASTTSRTSTGSSQSPLAGSLPCGSPPACCEEPCPPDCGDVCIFVCSDPVCGECVVTLSCDGEQCTVIECEPLAPGEAAPAGLPRIECTAPCGESCSS
jgi:hypothetical protein